MCTQLCTLRTGIIGIQLLVLQSDHQFPVLWDGRRTVLNAGRKTAKSRPHRKLKIEMSLYSCSITVIHHDSPWLIRHDTLSVRVRQYSDNRSGSGMYCMHANDLCVEPGVFVIRYHHWDKPCRKISVKTLGRPRITTEIRSDETARFQSFPHQWHRSRS